ncbi:2-trimethylaminoethylphosphonate dioxygenase [Aestuariispira insulae]|uniref:Gamma-butyrobetaine dioxygenase n=1 Tax=Aestuariispira insulae TaxID=1461337 RepID=A0A3D9HH38_9PROT|nr:TauD/TfdA family dioxygenase [Aestuariispira insulae]RED48571.1 gamma-butyrobetaine dioxygenase [Aestuariispira insulae]
MVSLNEVMHDQQGVTAVFSDGTVSRFHGAWLRDNDRGQSARHADNDQRLFDITELPDDLSIEGAVVTDDHLDVAFAADGHVARFPVSWLFDNRYDREHETVLPDLWGAHLKTSLPVFDFSRVLEDDRTRMAWLQAVRDQGFGILENVPCEEGMVCRAAEIFGYVRETNYGRLFEVRSEENPVNLAYTGLGLNVHTDNPYRDPVPGLQLLHCLISNPDGGDTLLVDGFHVAETLRRENPAAFGLLCENWVPFRYRGDSSDLQARGPIIQLNDRGRIIAVRYNNRSAAPFDLPAEKMEAYYDAYRLFAKMLHRPEFELTFKLTDGQLMAFDNQRVLHGRKGFGGGKRHLQGCYADKDSLLSALRVLEAQS